MAGNEVKNMGRGCGCVMLAGGAGKRMGAVNKAELLYRETAFGDVIRGQLEMLGVPCFVSAAAYMTEEKPKWPVIYDEVRDGAGQFIGPLGGIRTCLRQTGLDGIFVVSCDMPLFRKEMASVLAERRRPSDDALVWQTRDGKIHPACAFYSKSCLPVIEQEIRSGDYKVMNLLSKVNCRVVKTSEEHIPDKWFLNVNDRESYEKLGKTAAPVLAVSGRKNTGKTTLLEMIVRELSSRGVRCAVIKHDGHDFVPDVPGTDSYRLKQAGAYGTVVYSASRFSLVKDAPLWRAEDFFGFFPEADILLLEGQKNSGFPKIEVMRAEISREPVCDPNTVIACVADWDPPSCDRDRILEQVISCIDGFSSTP